MTMFRNVSFANVQHTSTAAALGRSAPSSSN